LEDPLHVVERVRPVLVTRELDRAPDGLRARLLLETLELVLQAVELTAQLRSPEELHGAELTKALAQPDLCLARHALSRWQTAAGAARAWDGARRAGRLRRDDRSGISPPRGRSRRAASPASSARRLGDRRTTSARPAPRARRRRGS